MRTINGKLQTANFLRMCAFVFGIILLPFSVFRLPSQVSAQSRLTYPIPDLGYCRDAKECYLYCEIPQNKAACWSYGKYKVGSDVLGVTTMSDITFPIAELENCAGPQECRDFCEESTNQTTCMDFAKKKGFHKETARDELLQKAKTELGCTSMESCSRVCESDHSRCEAFAKKHGVYQEPPESSGRYSAEKKRELMQKAQSELGCTSMESCKSICETNPERCMAFAKKHGFDKGEGERREQYESREYQPGAPSGVTPNYGVQRFGKGGCDSEESCKKYCQEHPSECPGFQGYTRAIDGGESYVGPSGCRTEAECKSWCETNPDKCPGFNQVKQKEMESSQELQKRQFETNREMMQQNYEYRPPTTQPSSGSYTPPATQPSTPNPTP